jgi:hypothetical protein
VTDAGIGTDVSLSLIRFPRELELSHDGDTSAIGIVRNEMLVNTATLGSFSIEFSNVTHTRNENRNRAFIGLYTDDAERPPSPSSGSGIVFSSDFSDPNLDLIINNNGNRQVLKGATSSGFNGEQYQISVDRDDNIAFSRDGEILFQTNIDVNGPLQPFVAIEDNANTNTGETLTVGEIAVSPLTEVLR